MDLSSIELSPTSSGGGIQETHHQKKRKLPSRKSIPFTGSCQEDDQRKKMKCSEHHYQNLSSGELSSTPPMTTGETMPSSLHPFGATSVPAEGIPLTPMNSDENSVKNSLSEESLNMGDWKNNPESDYKDEQSPFFTLLEIPSSPLCKPTEIEDLISRLPSSIRLFGFNINPTSVIPIPTRPTNSHKISTKLTLFDESWDVGVLSNQKGKLDQEEEEEVSTEMKLYNDPWKIKKTLTEFDCSSMCMLMLPKNLIEIHVKLQMKDNRGITDEDIKRGINVRVWDYDSGTEHIVKFKGVSINTYIFGSNWKREFVERRGLGVDDEIGLFWDDYEFRFGFRVLFRARLMN